MIRDLHVTQSTTLDSSGRGTISVGPNYYNERWEVVSIAVTSEPTTKIPSVHLFKGTVMLGYTFGGNNDTGSIGATMFAGEKLTAYWGYPQLNGRIGDPGIQVTITLYGKQYIGEETP
jgi:hypothetical protein